MTHDDDRYDRRARQRAQDEEDAEFWRAVREWAPPVLFLVAVVVLWAQRDVVAPWLAEHAAVAAEWARGLPATAVEWARGLAS